MRVSISMRARTALAVLAALVPMGCADLIGVETLTGRDAGSDVDSAVADAGAEADSCAVAWVGAANGDVPQGAVADYVRDGGATIYVCRAPSGTDAVPGKLLSSWGCFYSDGQAEQLASTYEVLVPSASCAVAWAPAPGSIAPPYAIECGHDTHGALYSCRVASGPDSHELGHMGWGTSHACVYSLSGMSITTSDFEILTVR
jgi:hypothetical protein